MSGARWRQRAPVLTIVSATALLASAVVALYAQDLTMLEETVAGPYALAGTLHVTDPATLSVLVVIDQTDANNRYTIRVTPGETIIERVQGGHAQRIGHTRAHGPFVADTDLELTVRRDGWRLDLILDREVLARAYDSTLPPGRVGFAVAGGEIPDPMLQPTGGVYLTDPFERVEDASVAQGTWEPVQGTWKLQALRVDEQSERMESDKSANAFSYLGKGDGGPGIACTGYWFWSDYSVRAAVRPAASDPLGLIAYYQDPQNYIVARWTSALSDADDADCLQLLTVVAGTPAAVAEAPGGHLPNVWYQVELRICDGLAQVLVDDEPRLAATVGLFGQGQPGLYCEGAAGTFFDSVVVEDWTVLSDDFATTIPGRWVPISGSWRPEGGQMRGGGDNGLVVTGRADWSRYAWASDVCAQGKAGVGLVACAANGRSYVLRIGTVGSGLSYAGEAQIAHIEGGQPTVLSSAPAHVPPGTWHRLRLVADSGLITGYLDDKRILDAFDAGATAGRPGLYVDGPGAGIYDNVYLTMLPPLRVARVTKEFTESDAHPEMAEWASTRAPWIKPDEDGGAWWTKGDYFGDKVIAFEIPQVGAAEGEVRLQLDSAPEEAEAGLTLVITAAEDSKSLGLKLLAGAETLEETTVEVTGDPCPVRFERRGTWVVVTVDGSVVISLKHL